MKRNHGGIQLLILVGMILLLFALQAHAAPLNSSGLLDNILQKFSDTASHWQGKIVFYASWLFWTMALLSMVWTFGMLALKNAGLSEALAEIIRFFAVTGFFWWLLINGPAISASIIESMQQISAEASGLGHRLTPSGIVDIGFEIFSKVVDQSSIWSPVDSLVGMVIAGIVSIVLAVVGVNMLLLLISSWMLIYSGVFLLGFGGGHWTSDIAINYYKTVLGVAVQIFAMILIIGIGKSFIDQYYATVQTGSMDIKSLFVMLVASVILLTLVNKIPPLLASIISSGGSTMGIGGFGASAAVGAATVAAAAVNATGDVLKGGAAAIGGGVAALKAAFQQAQQHQAEGSGLFSSGSSQNGRSPSGGSGGFKSAMATASIFAADMGANLVKGVSAIAKDEVANKMDAVKEKIGETTGGKVASEISHPGSTTQSRHDRQDMAAAEGLRQESRGQEARDFIAQNAQQFSSDGGNAPSAVQNSFGGDNLSAGKTSPSSPPINDEVDAFVNKKSSTSTLPKKDQ